MPLPSLPLPLPFLRTGSFAHLGVTCLRPSIPMPIAPCIRLRYLPASSALTTPAGFPTVPPKPLLTLHSAASEPPFAATTALGSSPLPHNPSFCRKSQVSASTPPTPPLSSAACQCTPPVSEFPRSVLVRNASFFVF